MAILTHREYEAKNEIKQSGAVTKIAAPIDTIEEETEHVLFYPDNGADRYHNGTYKLEIDGMIKDIEIVNGSVRVGSQRECEALKRDGFLFVSTREVKNE